MKLLFGLKAILIACFGMMNAAHSSQSPPLPQPDVHVLLKKLAGLPDLLFLSRNQAKGGDAYALQKKIEKGYRAGKAAFKITTVFRHLERCSTAAHQFGATKILVVNPAGESIQIAGAVLHEIESHGAAFPTAVAVFLLNLPDTVPDATPGRAFGLKIVDFPGSIVTEQNVPGAYDEGPSADPRWVVPKEILFTAPAKAERMSGIPGRVRIQASLSNPTAGPIKVVFWQVQTLQPLYVVLTETAGIKKKPRDPRAPFLPPPVPLPPIRITIPAKTVLRFTDEVDLANYVFPSGSAAEITWSFHFWKAPEKRGTISFKLP